MTTPIEIDYRSVPNLASYNDETIVALMFVLISNVLDVLNSTNNTTVLTAQQVAPITFRNFTLTIRKHTKKSDKETAGPTVGDFKTYFNQFFNNVFTNDGIRGRMIAYFEKNQVNITYETLERLTNFSKVLIGDESGDVLEQSGDISSVITEVLEGLKPIEDNIQKIDDALKQDAVATVPEEGEGSVAAQKAAAEEKPSAADPLAGAPPAADPLAATKPLQLPPQEPQLPPPQEPQLPPPKLQELDEGEVKELIKNLPPNDMKQLILNLPITDILPLLGRLPIEQLPQDLQNILGGQNQQEKETQLRELLNSANDEQIVQVRQLLVQQPIDQLKALLDKLPSEELNRLLNRHPQVAGGAMQLDDMQFNRLVVVYCVTVLFALSVYIVDPIVKRANLPDDQSRFLVFGAVYSLCLCILALCVQWSFTSFAFLLISLVCMFMLYLKKREQKEPFVGIDEEDLDD